MNDRQDEPDGLGWALSEFLHDTIRPHANGQVGSAQLYDAYRQWCRQRRRVPYLEAEFLDLVMKVAATVGIPIKQTGANIVLFDLELIDSHW